MCWGVLTTAETPLPRRTYSNGNEGPCLSTRLEVPWETSDTLQIQHGYTRYYGGKISGQMQQCTVIRRSRDETYLLTKNLITAMKETHLHYLEALVKPHSLSLFGLLLKCTIKLDAKKIRGTHISSYLSLRRTQTKAFLNSSYSSVNPTGDSSVHNRTHHCWEGRAPTFLSFLFSSLRNNWNYEYRWGVTKHTPQLRPNASSALHGSVSSPNIFKIHPSLQPSPYVVTGSKQIPSSLAAICVGSAVPLQHGTPLC